jgi:hypothetical protein
MTLHRFLISGNQRSQKTAFKNWLFDSFQGLSIPLPKAADTLPLHEQVHEGHVRVMDFHLPFIDPTYMPCDTTVIYRPKAEKMAMMLLTRDRDTNVDLRQMIPIDFQIQRDGI